MSGKYTPLSVKIHNWLEDSTSRARKALPKRKHVEGSLAHRILGATILRKELWSFKGEAMAKGLAVGLFIAFTPTIGFQTLLVCICLMFFPGNLPIAVAACWLTNPFTAVPVYSMEWLVGKAILESLGYHPTDEPPRTVEFSSSEAMVDNILAQGATLWIGSIISSAIIAAVGYALFMGIVYLERWLRRIKLEHRKKVSKDIRDLRKSQEIAIISNNPGAEEGEKSPEKPKNMDKG